METPSTYLSPSSQTQFHSSVSRSLPISPNGNEKACLLKLYLQLNFFFFEKSRIFLADTCSQLSARVTA